MEKLIIKEANNDTNMNSSNKKKFDIKFNKKLIVIASLIIVAGLGTGIVANAVLANKGSEQDKCTVALDNIKAKGKQDLTTDKNTYEAAQVKCEDNSQHVSIENLKKDLNNAVIKSPFEMLKKYMEKAIVKYKF